jgi:hypothetical protein
MSGSRLPLVTETWNGHFAVSIAPQVVLTWWWEPSTEGLRCYIRVYGKGMGGAVFDEDVISFPVQPSRH